MAAWCFPLLLGVVVGSRQAAGQAVADSVRLSVEAAVADPAVLSPLIDETPPRTWYNHPGQCVGAGQWREAQFWRTMRPDTIAGQRHGTPKQPVAVEAVRRCVEQFDPKTIAADDWLGLGAAYLAAEEFAAADTVFARLAALVATRPTPERAWTLHTIVDAYLNTDEPRVASAQRYAAQLDALGAPAAVERMLAHLSVAIVAHAQDTVPLWEGALMAGIAASRQMTGDAQKDYAGTATALYDELSILRERQGKFAEADSVIAQGEQIWVAIRPSLARSYRAMRLWTALLGTPASRIAASQWGPLSPGDTVHPTPGRVGVYVYLPTNCGAGCAAQYALLKRLAGTYGSVLDLTAMLRTGGYYQDRLVTADSEVMLSQHGYVTWWHLPITLAFWKSTLGRRSDGRVTAAAGPNRKNYQLPPSIDPVAFIVDKKGVIRLVTPFTRANEPLLRDVIDELANMGSSRS
jgi:hypothetical protein